jgi:hypothetical protein
MAARHKDASATHLPETYSCLNKLLLKAFYLLYFWKEQKFSSYKEITLKILKGEGLIYFLYYIPLHTAKKYLSPSHKLLSAKSKNWPP